MSLWTPPKNVSLTVQFNTNVSNAAYTTARDNVLLTRGVTLVSEDDKKRAMKLEVNNSQLQSTLEQVPGVESVTREAQPFTGKHRL